MSSTYLIYIYYAHFIAKMIEHRASYQNIDLTSYLQGSIFKQYSES